MKQRTTIIGLSGSLRERSYNTALLRAAADLTPAGSVLQIRTMKAIPLYNGDDEAKNGPPESVTKLKEEISEAHGLLIATPEYNNSIPGTLKNTIDWLSREPQPEKPVFEGKPLALIGASPGGFGTILSQNAWLPVCRYLRADFWMEGRLLISKAADVFDDSGKLVSEKTSQQLQEFLQGFVRFVESRKL